MSLIQKLNWRYATKTFDKDKKLNQEQIDNIIEAFRLAPSSYGLQPWKLLLISNPDMREKLKAVSWNQSQVTDASHFFVLCRQNKIDENYINKYIQEVGAARNMPELSTLDGYKQMMTLNVVPRPDQESWMAKQVYIALGLMMSICADLDIDCCAMEGFDAAEYSKILGLESLGLSACVLLPVGYRNAEDMTASNAKVRKSKADIFTEIL
jgi:nitroreductase